jgi:hypothetical protein
MTEQQSAKSDSSKSNLQPSRKPLIAYGAAFALLGLSAGIFAGLSNSPVVGVLLPLLFGLIGGANGFYLYRIDLTDKLDLHRLKIVGQMLTVFLIFLLTGTFYGILVRTGSELSSLVPRLQPLDEPTELPVVIPDLDTLDTGTALELTLLRYRLQALGTNKEEQKVILATARKWIGRPFEPDQFTSSFERLLTLNMEILSLMNEQDLDYDVAYKLEQLEDFLIYSSQTYEYLIDALPLVSVPIKPLTELIDEDHNTYSGIIWPDATFKQFLNSHPEFHEKLLDMEIAYLEIAYEFRDYAWLSDQPTTEAIDRLIQTSSPQVSTSTETGSSSDIRPGLQP